VTEHGAIEENTVAAIKVEELVSVKQIMTVKQSMKYIDQTCRNRKWHWKAQPGSKKL
jgi:Mg/Co/Ni transporter MgtE